jgi:AcrR family transcriptional regulator
MPRTKEQNEAIREEKRQMIMETAMQLFAEDGYMHTSIDRIAAKAGVSKGLVYNYFESKDDLLRQIFISGIRKISETGLFRGEITTDSLICSMEKMFDMIVEYKDFFKLYTALVTQPGIVQKIATIIDTNNEIKGLLKYFAAFYGEKALDEVLLFSTISKGYSMLSLYAGNQSVMSIDTLKSVLMNFIRERWGNESRQISSRQDRKEI